MKGILCYFSGTGNTKWAAEKFKDKFRAHSTELDLVNIEKIEEVNLQGVDFLIIGTPVYAEMEPKIIDDFINMLPVCSNNLKCLVYSTQGGRTAAAPGIIGNLLRAKGFAPAIEIALQVTNNYSFAVGKKISENEEKERLKKAEQLIENVTLNFINGVKMQKISPFRVILGKIVGKGYIRTIPKISKKITSSEGCDKCGVCLRNCPKGNITFQKDKAVFHSNCIMCLRCLHICPINAVRYNGKKVVQNQKQRIKCLNIR